ncbi:SMI1/KNR4 family protein [Flavobacterium ardleyense]|uniref:SMI1/KNR4 family protein n=1 Tax=Flavobacterium ardleyense TaxID=2038737 RepID=A0ABW5ZAT5_9FLAO
MEQDLINRISNFIHPNSEIDLSGIPATDLEIINAETILNVKFHSDYKEFIKKFGGSYAGIPIYAFKNNEMLSSDTVIDLTKNFRQDYHEDRRSNIINKSYVISFDDMGNPIMIDKDENMIIFYHDSDGYAILTNSFASLIQGILEGKSLYDFN